MPCRTVLRAVTWLAASCAGAAHAQAPLDGQLDAGFGSGGIATIEGVPTEGVALRLAAAAVDDASGLVVLGRGSRMGSPVFAAVRLTRAGAFDATYGQNGVTTIPVPFEGSVPIGALTMDAVRLDDGRVVVGAYTQRDFDTVGLFVFALDAAGNLVADYGPGGAPGFVDLGSFQDTDFPYPPTGSVELGPDGSVHVATRRADGQPTAVGRLDANGSLDPAFGVLGVAEVSASSHGLTIQPDGKLLLISAEFVGPDDTRAGVRRLLASGAPDLAFGTGGFAGVDFQPGFDSAVAIAVDGERIFLGASASGLGGACGLCVARLTANGELDTTFNPGGAPPGIVRTRADTSDEGVGIHVGVGGGIGFTATLGTGPDARRYDVGAFVVQPNGRTTAAFPESVFRHDLGGGARSSDYLRYSLVDRAHRLLLIDAVFEVSGFVVAAIRLDTVFRDDHED